MNPDKEPSQGRIISHHRLDSVNSIEHLQLISLFTILDKAMASFDTIIARIKLNEAHILHEGLGQQFNYFVKGSASIPSSTNQNIPQAHFASAAKPLLTF